MTKTASIKYNGESNDKERLLKPLAVKAKDFSRQITNRNSRFSVFNEIFLTPSYERDLRVWISRINLRISVFIAMWEQKNDDQKSLNENTMEPIESWEGTATEALG